MREEEFLTRGVCGGTLQRTLQMTRWSASARRTVALLGGIAGGGTAFVGWGAAQVLIPGLVSPAVGATALNAAALNLCALSAITAVSAVVFEKGAGAVDPWTALSIGAPAMACAPLGAIAARRVAGRTLQIAFHGITVVCMPLQGLSFASRWRRAERSSGPARGMAQLWHLDAAPSLRSPETMRHAGFGTVCGFLSGFLGVAGLPYVVSYLTYATTLEHNAVVGTTMAAVAPSVVVGALAHCSSGSAPIALAAPLMVAAGAGCVVGGSAALRVPEAALQALFVATLALASVRSGRTLFVLLRP